MRLGSVIRVGAKSGRGRLDRRKRDSGIKDRDDKSNGVEILMVETFAKIKPTDPLITLNITIADRTKKTKLI